ncbi:MAG: hypothetical protein ACREPS_03920 [Rhodanobacteraceae bacterium]
MIVIPVKAGIHGFPREHETLCFGFVGLLATSQRLALRAAYGVQTDNPADLVSGE